MADKYSPGMEFQSWRSLPRGPLAEVGDAAKKGLLLYGLHKVGAIDALNKIGLKQNDTGAWQYKSPTQATPPVGAVPPASPVAAEPVLPVAPSAPESAPVQMGAPIAAPIIEEAPLPSMMPNDAGKRILDGEYHGSSDEDQLKTRDVAQDQIPQQYAQAVPPPNAGYPQLPQSNGGLMQLLAAFV